MSGPPAILVGRDSATHGIPEADTYPFSRTHSEIVKFVGRDDEGYKTVKDYLMTFTKEAGGFIQTVRFQCNERGL